MDFLTLCKDADPDILTLKEAKAEYATLRSPLPVIYFPKGESPKNVSEQTFSVFRSRTVTVVTSLRRLMLTFLSFEIATVRDPMLSPLLFT